MVSIPFKVNIKEREKKIIHEIYTFPTGHARSPTNPEAQKLLRETEYRESQKETR